MRKSALKIICIVSGIVWAILSIVVVCSAVQAFKSVGTAIIGGAGWSTMRLFLQRATNSPAGYAATVALFLFLGTGLGLIFCKKQKG